MSDAARRIAYVIEWLKRPDWGQWKYMEGSEIYTHKEDALVDLNSAVVALEDAEAAAFLRGAEAMRAMARADIRARRSAEQIMRDNARHEKHNEEIATMHGDRAQAFHEAEEAIAALPPPEDKR